MIFLDEVNNLVLKLSLNCPFENWEFGDVSISNVFLFHLIPEYSSIAPNTKTMQAITQLFIAVNPSAWNNSKGKLIFKVWICLKTNLWRVCLDSVVNVDKDKKQCYKHCHSAWNHFWIYQKTKKKILILNNTLFAKYKVLAKYLSLTLISQLL